MVLDQSAGLASRGASQFAARAIGRCLLGIGPVDRLLAVVDGHSDDLDGLDSADTLARLASLFGWGTLDRQALEVSGIRNVTTADLAAARQCGGALKPVVFATIDASGAQAFVGPGFLSSSQPLASLEGGLQGIHIAGADATNLFLSSQNLGLDLTPETHLQPRGRLTMTRSPATPWFARVTFPGVVPPNATVAAIAGAAGLSVERVVDHPAGHSRWLLIGPHSRTQIDVAAQRLAAMHRIEAVMFRRITILSNA